MRDALKPNQRQSGVIKGHQCTLRVKTERGADEGGNQHALRAPHLITRFLRHLSESGGCMRLVKRPPDEGGHQRSSVRSSGAIRGRPSEGGRRGHHRAYRGPLLITFDVSPRWCLPSAVIRVRREAIRRHQSEEAGNQTSLPLMRLLDGACHASHHRCMLRRRRRLVRGLLAPSWAHLASAARE